MQCEFCLPKAGFKKQEMPVGWLGYVGAQDCFATCPTPWARAVCRFRARVRVICQRKDAEVEIFGQMR